MFVPPPGTALEQASLSSSVTTNAMKTNRKSTSVKEREKIQYKTEGKQNKCNRQTGDREKTREEVRCCNYPGIAELWDR